jgi:hypothetical protein
VPNGVKKPIADARMKVKEATVLGQEKKQIIRKQTKVRE